MESVYLSLGGNVGDVKANMLRCLLTITNDTICDIEKVSSLYRTPPWGKIDQDWFYNCCIQIKTKLLPNQLLDYCKSIEISLGRVDTVRWGPRVIDIDILLYKNIVEYSDEFLTIPHRYMLERAFVLLPLYEIAPNLTIKGKRLSNYILELDSNDVENIQLCVDNNWNNIAMSSSL